MVGFGVVLWAVGVLSVRILSPLGVFAGPRGWLVLAATVPLVWLTLRLVVRLAPAFLGVVEATALVSAPALLLDGLAFTATPWIYGQAEGSRRAAAAWLLWFVGVSLAMALWRGTRQAPRR